MLLLVDGFLSPQECEAVRALGSPHLKRSKVSAGGRPQRSLAASTAWLVLRGHMHLAAGMPTDKDASEATAPFACRCAHLAPLAALCQPIRPLLTFPTKQPVCCPTNAGDETPLRTSSSMFITGALVQHPASLHLDARVTQLTEVSL